MLLSVDLEQFMPSYASLPEQKMASPTSRLLPPGSRLLDSQLIAAIPQHKFLTACKPRSTVPESERHRLRDDDAESLLSRLWKRSWMAARKLGLIFIGSVRLADHRMVTSPLCTLHDPSD